MPVDKVYDYLINLTKEKNMSFFNDFTKEVIGTEFCYYLVLQEDIISSLVRRFAK
jgi:hypothetical protein